jgi:hypothetical protein
MHVTTQDGIAFYETRPAGYEPIESINVESAGILSMKSLRDVKHELAVRASRVGGNAIVDFKYGQRSYGIFRSLFHLGDHYWHGAGTIARVPNTG